MKIFNMEEIYDRCLADGYIRKKDEIDIELAKSLLTMTKDELEFSKETEKKSGYYSILFKNRYDILRQLISAFLLFDKMKIENHQCMNAYLCVNYPELEIDWELLEGLRTMRNAIIYEGRQISLDDWKTYKLQLEIYISSFVKSVEEKITEFGR